MKRNESVKYDILAAIEGSGRHVSFDDLTAASGLSFVELSSVIGLLLKERRIGLYAMPHVNEGCSYRSRIEDLFYRFMDLLSDKFMCERSVSYYASVLCISPKYLSTTIKRASGKTPTEWINERTVKEIEYRLRYSQASIKEIARDLNFCNLSHFGKYFKSVTNMSPSHYRMMHGKMGRVNSESNSN